MGLEESRVVNQLLARDRLYQHLCLPEPFPTTATIYESHVRLDAEPLENAVARIFDKSKHHKDQIKEGLSWIQEFNTNLSVDKAKSLVALEGLARTCGFSHALLRKQMLLQSALPSQDALQLIISEQFEGQNVAPNNTVYLALADTYGEQYDLTSIIRNINSIANLGSKNQLTRDLCRFAVAPIPRDESTFISTLQSFEQVSLLDAVFYLHLSLRTATTPIMTLSDALQAEIVDTFNEEWAAISSVKVELPFWDMENNQHQDHRLFRLSSAIVETRSVFQWREVVDFFYNDRTDRMENARPTELGILGEHFLQLKDIRDICDWDKREELDLQSYSPKKSGYLSRSIAFSYLLEKNRGNINLSESEFMRLMSVTREIIHIPDHKYLEVVANNSKSTLIKFIVMCMTYQRSVSERRVFALRRLLQELVLSSFDGNLLSFMEYLHGSSPELSYFVYEFADEAFLSQLFRLYSTSDEFLEARADLHDWYSKKTGDKVYAERAKTLRIDLKLQKIRGEIDDTRIFVDPSRYFEWLLDNLLTDISGALRGHTTTLSHSDVSEGTADLPNHISAEQRMLRVMSVAFKEFYTNTHFGIASYLGRRIRHGTLKGTLTGPVDKLLSEDRFKPLFRNDLFRKQILNWRKDFADGIAELTGDYLQIRSSRKPRGVFQTKIDTQGRSVIIKAAIDDIFANYIEADGIQSALSRIATYNWRLIEDDLSGARKRILTSKNKWGLPNLHEVRRSASQVERQCLKEFERDIGGLIDDRFRTIINWFNRPQNLSPSASLNELFEAVLAEVRDTFHNYEPEVSSPDNETVTITGGAYHVIYDALYVVIHNAAEHGKADGKLTYSFGFFFDKAGNKRLSVVLKSQISEHDRAEDVQARINEVLMRGPDGAQVVEGKSGLRKLLSLNHENKEMDALGIQVEEEVVVVSFSYELAY